jgi:hypothetical protein
VIGLATNAERDNEEEVEITSVAGAVKLAARFESIRFLPSAFESANESPYHAPASVYTAFETLDELALELDVGTLGQRLEDWLGERGVVYSPHESQPPMGRWGHERRSHDGPSEREIQGHLKFGADGDPQYCLRIYTEWDSDERRWLIGHVGRHLRNLHS